MTRLHVTDGRKLISSIPKLILRMVLMQLIAQLYCAALKSGNLKRDKKFKVYPVGGMKKVISWPYKERI